MKKKISQIVAYSVLGVLVVGLILCAVLKLDFKPDINIPLNTTQGTISISATDGTNNGESHENQINYKNFAEKFDNAFKLTVLYSLFSGKIGTELIVNDKITSGKPSVSGFEVTIYYTPNEDGDLQTLKYKGNDMKYSQISSAITFDRILFGVEGGRGLAETNLYFYTTGKSVYYKVTALANFDELYNYINNIDNLQK